MRKNNLCKNLITVMTVAGMMVSLAGCGNVIPNMTDSQLEEIGDYAGIVLLKYDASHRSRLVDVSEYEESTDVSSEESNEIQEETDENQEEVTEVKPVELPGLNQNSASEGEREDGSSESGDETGLNGTEVTDISGADAEPEVQKTFAEMLGLPEETVITCTGYEWTDEYSEPESNNSTELLDHEDEKYLIVNYDVYNENGNIDVNYMDSGLTFGARIGSVTKIDTPSMINNELPYFVGTICNGHNDFVLIFEFDDAFSQSADQINIIVTRSENKETYTETIN